MITGNRLSSTADRANRSDGPASSFQHWQAVFDGLEDEVLIIDRDYRIVEANKSALLRLGKRREEVLGHCCYDISHGLPELCRPPRLECPLKTVWETGKPARATHCHVYRTGAEEKRQYLDIVASPVLDEQGSPIAVAEVMRDITVTKELEQKIAESHRDLLALRTITGVVSQSLDLDTVLGSALDKTLRIMKANSGGILLLDEEKQELCYKAYRGLSRRYAEEMCMRVGEGIAGKVAQTGEAILVEDLSNDPRAFRPALIAAEKLRAVASVPLRLKEKVLGVMNIASSEPRRFTKRDIQFLDSVAAQVAIAVENAKLHQEVQHQDMIRRELLREILSIQEEERRRIARELHDETSQSLASLSASLEAVMGMLPPGASEAKSRLRKIQDISVSILDEVHRLVYELRPTLLDDLGLVAATRWLADNNLGKSGVKVIFKTRGRERRLPPALEATLFRVVQEAVSNIAHHAGAANASIALDFQKRAIRVHVKDDGKGFDVEEAITSKERPRGLGLLGMRERIELVNGTLNIVSRAGAGTQIDIRIPLDSEV
ncbi:MAG: GAF domain-containing protein [Dehalococcoidia bacterium]|nr:GAF domain-containing protein [Dehalococcoidia bacterium]